VGLTSGAAPKKELTDYSGATVPEFHRLPNPQFQDNTIGVGLQSMKNERNHPGIVVSGRPRVQNL